MNIASYLNVTDCSIRNRIINGYTDRRDSQYSIH